MAKNGVFDIVQAVFMAKFKTDIQKRNVVTTQCYYFTTWCSPETHSITSGHYQLRANNMHLSYLKLHFKRV
jgi:hypothetical protein